MAFEDINEYEYNTSGISEQVKKSKEKEIQDAKGNIEKWGETLQRIEQDQSKIEDKTSTEYYELEKDAKIVRAQINSYKEALVDLHNNNVL